MNEQPIIKPVDFFLGVVMGALLTGVIAVAWGSHSAGGNQGSVLGQSNTGTNQNFNPRAVNPDGAGVAPFLSPVNVSGIVIDESGAQLPSAKSFTATVLSTYMAKVGGTGFNLNQPPKTAYLTATYKPTKSTYYTWLNTTAASQTVNIDFDQKGNGPLLDIDCSIDAPNLSGYSIALVQGANPPVTLTANGNLHYTSQILSGQQYNFAMIDASGDTITDVNGASIVGGFTAPVMDKLSTLGFTFTLQ